MDFGFTAEQEMLRDAARKFLAAECPPAVPRAAMQDATAHDAALWKRIAALGWPGILVPADCDGQGGDFLDLAVVLEESGKVLLPGPFFAIAALGAVVVRDGGSTEQRARLLPALARGECLVVPVLPTGEDAASFTLENRSGGHVVSGRARFVMDAHVADVLVVPVGTTGALVVVERGPDVEVTTLHTVDGTRRLCTVELRGAACEPLGAAARGADALRRVRDHALAGLALELVGVGQRALEMAVAYANERTQFGRPIGSFQAIKHKCVDMMVAVETARSLAYYAAWAVAENAADAPRATAMAKAYCGDMAKTVTSEAIQVHGGIGFTWEHDLHLYYRRALAADAAFGSAPAHREAIVRAIAP